MAGFIISEEEILDGAIDGNYQTLYAAGQNNLGDKLVIRNTTLTRLQLRFGADDDSTITISIGEKMILAGFSALAGSLIEVRSVVSDPASIRVNTYQ